LFLRVVHLCLSHIPFCCWSWVCSGFICTDLLEKHHLAPAVARPRESTGQRYRWAAHSTTGWEEILCFKWYTEVSTLVGFMVYPSVRHAALKVELCTALLPYTLASRRQLQAVG